MKATTIKIDGDILRALEQSKPARQTVTAFVKEILRQELDRRQLRESAEKYQEFLENSPDEREWLTEWEQTDLASPVKRKRSVRRKQS